MTFGSPPHPESLRFRGSASGTPILCLAGFGDDGTMYEPLGETRLAERARLCLLDLPGCGAQPPYTGNDGMLSHLVTFVGATATSVGASVVVAHSAASIIAGLAARRPDSGVTTLISLEGNLTAADSYFTGLAARYESPATFLNGFLDQLDRHVGDSLMSRYRDRVARADPHTLWQLGRDVATYSTSSVPGELLQTVKQAAYLYNPVNCAESSLAWLATSGLRAIELPGASHWPTQDAPELVAEAVLAVLEV